MKERSTTDRANYFDLGQIGLPEVPLLGLSKQTSALDALTEHHHDGCMEVHYVFRGKQGFRVGKEDYLVEEGDLIVTLPFEAHSTGSLPLGRADIYWTQILLEPKPKSFLCLDGRTASSLIKKLKAIPRRQFKGSRRVRELFAHAYGLLKEDSHGNMRIAAATAVVQLLLEIIECGMVSPVSVISEDIQRAIDYINANRDKAYNLDVLARVSGLSLARFKSKFRQQVETPPGEYILQKRIEFASNMLRKTNLTVTEIAFESGFFSSQYFATMFRRFTGKTPSRFREEFPE